MQRLLFERLQEQTSYRGQVGGERLSAHIVGEEEGRVTFGLCYSAGKISRKDGWQLQGGFQSLNSEN